MDLIIKINPNKILDVGTGFGKYGVLCREFLELWNGKQEYHNFLRTIDGIEIFLDYITPLHHFIYDNIFVGNALDLVEKIDKMYDLVLLIDVLEHFNKNSGRLLINRLLKTSKGILISVPKIIGNQKDSFNNIYETHRAQWSKKELTDLGYSTFIYDEFSYVLYIGKKETVDILKKKFLLSSIRELFHFISFFVFNIIKNVRLLLKYLITRK